MPDRANHIVHGVGGVVETAADGTRMKAEGVSAVAIGTVSGVSALGVRAYDIVRGATGCFRRKPSSDGKTVVGEVKIEEIKDTETKYYGEVYAATKKEVEEEDIVETVIVNDKPVKRLNWSSTLRKKAASTSFTESAMRLSLQKTGPRGLVTWIALRRRC